MKAKLRLSRTGPHLPQWQKFEVSWDSWDTTTDSFPSAHRWHVLCMKLTLGENAGKKKAAIKWDSKCQQAFDDLKTLCTMAPILACANFSKPCKLHTDACGTGLGAVLYQTWEDGTKAVIAYASRSLNKAESHYPAHKLEFLALKWAVVEKFHKYLYGSTFDVYTNNNLLTYVLTTAKLDAASHSLGCQLGKL